jgi:hypothetical protein
MPKRQTRDNSYYEKQLQSRFPAIHSDYRVGKYRSLREALIAAGIKQPRSRLHELKNAWLKATAAERREFTRWLRTQVGAAAVTVARAGASVARPIAVDRRLEPWAVARIQAIMVTRRLAIGDVMDEMGFKRLNASLGRALARGDRLRPEVLDGLERWLSANRRI